QRVRRELRLSQAPLDEGGEAEGPDSLGGRVGREWHRLEGAIEMETLVEAEIEILPRFRLIRECREVAEARRDGEIGREGLVVGPVDILHPAGECRAVDVGVRSVGEALELRTGADRDAEGQVAERRRRRQIGDRECAPAGWASRAKLQRV